MDNIIYFELNNWFVERYFPDDEPFNTWFEDNLKIPFDNEDWVKENKLCVVFVVFNFVDTSSDYCITATKQWVEKNCPKLLTDYKHFLRFPKDNGEVRGRFGHLFLPYTEENIGITEQELF